MTFPNIWSEDLISIDVETNATEWWLPSVKIFGVAVATSTEEFYFDVRKHPHTFAWLRDGLKGFGGRVVNHAIKFDVHMLAKGGVDFLAMDTAYECTMVRAALINEHQRTWNLDDIAIECIGRKKVDPYNELASIFGGKETRAAQIGNLVNAPEELVAKYAKQDARLALDLWLWQEGEIKRQGLERIVNFERLVTPVIQDLERGGVRVDVELAERSEYDISVIVERKTEELAKEAGFQVNPNPSGSIHKLFNPIYDKDRGVWVSRDGTLLSSTGAGKPSIDANALRRMMDPCAARILELRKLLKCRDTFIRKHILERQYNGRVYPNINQCVGEDGGTVTGRLSYTSPALQQIPARDEEIKSKTRVLFLPEFDQHWLKCDYSQCDFRAMVHYTQSPPLVEAYRNNPDTDFHRIVSGLTGLSRSPKFAGDPNAKQLNLGMIFGMGKGEMAKQMGMPYTAEVDSRGREWLRPGPEVLEVYDKYHANVPGVQSFNKKATSVARSRGYVVSIAGRFLRFPDKNFCYKAPGYLYQSYTSEVNKAKMVETHRLLKGEDGRLVLTVHDELNFSIGDLGLVGRIRECMQDFHSDQALLKVNVPMRTVPEKGSSWYNVKEVK